MDDYAIVGGRVVDGTGAEPVAADVAVRGGRIVAVGALGGRAARETVDAAGLCVCPGFIDIHSHADLTLLADPRAESKLRMGVTLDVGGNCGMSAAPALRPEAARFAARLAWMGGLPSASRSWRAMGEHLRAMDAAGLGVNYACLVGHGTLRASVMGYERRRPTAPELDRMRRLLASALAEGALGLSTGLIYPPSGYADLPELIALAEVVAEHGGLYASHIRDEGAGLLGAVEEALAVGHESGVRVEISHLKCASRRHWGLTRRAVALIEEARRAGVDVAADQYPYSASSTGLDAYLPAWAHEGGVEALLGRLRDPEARARIAAETARLREASDPVSGWDALVIAGAERTPRWEGRSVRAVGAELGIPPEEAAMELLLLNDGTVQLVIHSMDEAEVRDVMRVAWVAVGSDSWSYATDGPLARGRPHPRGYGTFPRVLGRYVRELGVLGWGEAVRKMTALPAERLGLADRGRVGEGMAADLVLLDPERVLDRATYDAPHAYPEGIAGVMVGGRWALRDGARTEERPGRAVRGA